MDSSILRHTNLLEQYNLNLNFNPNNREKNIKELKYKIDMMIRTKGARMGAEYSKAQKNEEKEEDDVRRASLRNIKEEIGLRMEELKSKHAEIMRSTDLYELIYFYIQNACDEYIHSFKVRLEKSQEDNPEASEAKIKAYQYVCEQLTTPKDVKVYIEEILPFIASFDISKMNLSHLLKGKRNLSPCYSYRVSMYENAQLLLDMQTEKDVVRMYSFGVYQYKATTVDVFTPYEILGIVRKDPNGNIDTYSGIMALRKCKEVELTNMQASGDESKFPFDMSTKFVPNKGRGVKVKYTSPAIPSDMIPFIANVVATPVVLKNAINNNKGFIGSIEHGSGSGVYGGYKLVFDEVGTEELIESLSVAMEKDGEIKGMDTGLYGNNLAGVLLMAKCASLAAGYRMEYKEKEKNGITQGEE